MANGVRTVQSMPSVFKHCAEYHESKRIDCCLVKLGSSSCISRCKCSGTHPSGVVFVYWCLPGIILDYLLSKLLLLSSVSASEWLKLATIFALVVPPVWRAMIDGCAYTSAAIYVRNNRAEFLWSWPSLNFFCSRLKTRIFWGLFGFDLVWLLSLYCVVFLLT